MDPEVCIDTKQMIDSASPMMHYYRVAENDVDDDGTDVNDRPPKRKPTRSYNIIIDAHNINHNITFSSPSHDGDLLRSTSYDDFDVGMTLVSIDDENKNDDSSFVIQPFVQQRQNHSALRLQNSVHDIAAEEHHSVSFDFESNDNHPHEYIMQHTLSDNRATSVGRRRAQQQQPSATYAGSLSSSVLPSGISTATTLPQSCVANISHLVDDALTQVADIMLDSMRCGMDDTCHRWTYFPGEEGSYE